MRRFHEKLQEEHEIRLSHTWVQQALRGAGLVAAASAGRTDAGGHGNRRRACCCTLTAASIAG